MFLFAFTLLLAGLSPKETRAQACPNAGAECGNSRNCGSGDSCQCSINQDQCGTDCAGNCGGDPFCEDICKANCYTNIGQCENRGYGPPPGGTTCGGCQPGNYGFAGLGQINNVWFTNQTANSFTVNWERDWGGCANKSDNVVFIGTDKDVVNSNCFGCGAGVPGGSGATGDCGNKDYGSSNLPPGCLAERIVPMGTTSFSTAGSVTLDPTKNYYVKVIGWVHFTIYHNGNDQNPPWEEDVNDSCDAYSAKAFLGTCTTNSVPPNAPMSVGSPPQLFQTDVNTANNTITYSNPIVSTISFPTVKVIDPNDGTKSYPRTGLSIKGYRFGTGSDRLTIQNFPLVNYVALVTHRECDPETGKSCVTVVDGENVFLTDPGPGPVQVYIYGTFAGTAQLLGECINNGYPCSRLDHFYIPCNNTTATCPPQSSITIGPYTPYNSLVSVSNGPFFGSITSDSIYVPNYVWDFSHYTLTYSPGNGTPPAPFYAIDKVSYYPTTDNPPYISIANSPQYPNPDPTAPYQALVTALRDGVTNMRTNVIANGIPTPPACSSYTQINITGQVDPWWQVKDSDVQSNGDITSKIPTGSYFGDVGGGTFPGVPAYGGSTNLTTTNASQIGWLAKSPWSSPKQFDYAYFSNKIPPDVTFKSITSINDTSIAANDPTQHGYAWYKYDGSKNGGLPLTVDSATHISNKKVIILVDSANLNINNTINLADGQGFFMVIVNGNINVNSSVTGTPSLEGLYVADGTFSDGGGSAQLHVRGSVVAYGGIDLVSGRDLGAANSGTPAELFEYAPDQIMLFPSVLGYRKINWKEVAP